MEEHIAMLTLSPVAPKPTNSRPAAFSGPHHISCPPHETLVKWIWRAERVANRGNKRLRDSIPESKEIKVITKHKIDTVTVQYSSAAFLLCLFYARAENNE